MGHKKDTLFQPLQIAVLTVSDTRDESTDTSGRLLQDALVTAGHNLADKKIVIDDIYKIRAIVSQWIASDHIQAVLITGGTGFTARDSTPEAIIPLFDKEVTGYGELFRKISLDDIGTSTIQSRAIAGMANRCVIFAMPGSTNACRTAWEGIIQSQLDASYRPCNFVTELKNSTIEACETRG